MIFPPAFISPFNPIIIPLFNTIILLTSGILVNISHHLLIINKKLEAFLFLFIVVLLGLCFSLSQAFEYKIRNFSINDRVYARIFFISTGFHGIHVILGSVYLLINLFVFTKITTSFHLSIEFAI